MKKIYIGSSLKNYARIISLRNQLQKLGIELTYDWAESYKHALESNGKEDNSDFSLARIAQDEAEGVRRCDLFLMVCPGGRGAHVELGIAFALGKPIVILDESENQKDKIAFHLLFGVQRHTEEAKAVQDVLRLLA